jgi:hypothetical protein
MKLFDYPGEYFALQSLIAETMTDEEGNVREMDDATRATLNEMVDEFKVGFEGKVERTMQYRANLQEEIDQFESQIATRKKEIERLETQVKGRAAKIVALTFLVQTVMGMLSLKKMNAGSFTVSVVKNPPSMVVSDESKIPAKYWIEVPASLALNKAELKKDLVDKVEIEWVNPTVEAPEGAETAPVETYVIPGAAIVQGERLAVK